MSAKRVPSKRSNDESRTTAVAETGQSKSGMATQPNGLFAEVCIGQPLHHHNGQLCHVAAFSESA